MTGFTYLTVRVGDGLRAADGAVVPTQVQLTPTAAEGMRNGITVVPRVVRLFVGGDGTCTPQVAANTDPSTTPAGSGYLIEVAPQGAPSRFLYGILRHDAPGGVVDLDTLDELTEPPALVAPLRTIRGADDYDDTVAPLDGQGPIWSNGKYRPAYLGGDTGAAAVAAAVVAAHRADAAPHPAYDDIPSLVVLFENGLA